MFCLPRTVVNGRRKSTLVTTSGEGGVRLRGGSDNAPAASSAARPYFGWRIVCALFLAIFALFGVSIFSFIIFTAPLAEEYGWSAAQMGSLVSAMWLVAPLALFAGPITAHVSPWRLVILGLCIQAVALLALGHISELWQLYLLRIGMGLGKIMTAMSAPLIVARWFSRRFATAVAIVWAGGAAGGLVLAPLTEALVQAFGWRPASGMLTLAVLAIALSVALLARGPRGPHELAHDPEGVLTSAEGPAASSGRAAWAQIGKAPALLMVLSIVGIGMTAIATFSQQPAFLQSAGLSGPIAATLLGLTAAGSLVGSASIGWLLDTFRGWWSAALVAGAVYVGVLTLAVLPGHPSVLIAAVGALALGYGFGAGEVLWLTFTKRQFGEGLFPLTYGGWYFALQLGYALGGGVAGWTTEHLGSKGFLLLLAALYLTPTLVSLALRAARWRPAALEQAASR
ncbi:MFS transporter [Phenylobacterium sp. VNQ135]|uniref:MFS transporter n=1 Tax=Phenylobacterium sp. VNQ135 TaxID=3400922 RepID=UPI003C059984